MRFWLVLFFTLIFTTEIYAFNSLNDARISNGKLLLDFSKSISSKKVKYFKLKGDNSIRYVFDFSDAVVSIKVLTKNLHYGSVKSFRVSQFKRSIVRVVVEVKSPYAIAHKRNGRSQYQILLPARKSSKSKGSRKKQQKSKNAENPIDLFATIFSSKKTKRSPKKKEPSSRVRKPKKKYTIVVDAGHGGKDSGALGGSRRYMEKTVVLKIAKRVRIHLKKLGFRVHMTRNSNHYITLGTRTRYANRKHADAFVSIHANAVDGQRRYTAEGIETYYLQVSRSARSKRVAARENSVVLRKKDKISKNVILNLMTGPKIVMSNKMAIDVQKGMLKHLRRKYKRINDNGVRPAPFWVLVGAQMPSVLVETGYITNSKERKRLFDPVYQDKIAQGIAEGISNYFANREKEME